MVIEESWFEHHQRQQEQSLKLRQPGQETANEISDISLEGCIGKKHVFRMIKPAPWKSVDYLLRVPGAAS